MIGVLAGVGRAMTNALRQVGRQFGSNGKTNGR